MIRPILQLYMKLLAERYNSAQQTTLTQLFTSLNMDNFIYPRMIRYTVIATLSNKEIIEEYISWLENG